MKPYRSCSCRDPVTGRPYPVARDDDGKSLGRSSCPDLAAKKDHGGWYVRFEVPVAEGAKRASRDSARSRRRRRPRTRSWTRSATCAPAP